MITLLSPSIMLLFLVFLSSYCACFPFVSKHKTGCLFVFSCLVLRRGSHPQFMSEVLECLPWQGICKDVCNLLLCLNIFQLDVFFCYLFPQKMEDVLCFGVHYWILRYVYCTGVVIEYWNGLIILHLDIFQCLFHPNNLCATCCCRNIFCFCCFLSRVKLHLYSSYHQCFLPSLHLCRKPSSSR